MSSLLKLEKAGQPNLKAQFAHDQTIENVKSLWYDWFCEEKGLFNRGKRLWSAAKSIVDSPKFKADETYVFFKNNCPAADFPLYDDFRICDIKSGDVLYTVTRNAWGFSGWQVHTEGHWDKPIFEGSWNEVKKWFMTPAAKPASLVELLPQPLSSTISKIIS